MAGITSENDWIGLSHMTEEPSWARDLGDMGQSRRGEQRDCIR